ncbi:hypothetical protein, partial [Paraglaciecola sp.]|uniref:hypothetical protein n=1 Tax=Paraglaciecola sp. TaxID=1920173 RepID=UPI00273E1919
MYINSKFYHLLFLLCFTLLTTFLPFNSISQDGNYLKIISSFGNNALIEKYDVFSENNKEYTLKLSDSEGKNFLEFTKSEKSDSIVMLCIFHRIAFCSAETISSILA